MLVCALRTGRSLDLEAFVQTRYVHLLLRAHGVPIISALSILANGICYTYRESYGKWTYNSRRLGWHFSEGARVGGWCVHETRADRSGPEHPIAIQSGLC